MPAHPDFDDIVTTTMRNRDGKLADNATQSTAFLDRMRRKGKVRPANGGSTIVQGLESAINPNGGWYSGLDSLNTSAHEPLTSAEYLFKQAYVPVVWSGLDKLQNSGEHQVIDLIMARVKNGEKSLVELVSRAAYSDGTGSGGKQMHGLGLFVVISPATGTVGGIDRAGNAFWRNQVTSVTMTTGINIAATNPSNFLAALNSLSILTSRGKDRPDLYVADGLHYAAYLGSLQPLQRITSMEMAGYGFTSLKYNGVGGDADFVLDNSDYVTASRTWALNTDYLYLRPHPDRNFVAFGGDRIPVGQDGTIRHIGFTGNMTLANAARQGILFQN